MITSAQRFPLIQVDGVGPCLVVVMFDIQTQTAALAHLGALINESASIAQMAKEFERLKIPRSRLEVKVYGGWKNSSEASFRRIKKALDKERLQVTTIKALEYAATAFHDTGLLPLGMQSVTMVRNWQLDLRTGKMEEYTEIVPSKYKSQSFQIDSKLKILYKHEWSL